MSEVKKSTTDEKLPSAKIERRKWSFPFVWVVPIVAAVVAGFLVYQRMHEFGPAISIQFKNAGGMRPGQTQVEYRGVSIGEVTAVELSTNNAYAVVKVKLRRSAQGVARKRSMFWIVRPEVGVGTIAGLGTIVKGPHIEVFPGSDAAATGFIGLENAPAVLENNGLNIFLAAPKRGSLNAGSPVYYRGIQVGAVQDLQLSTNAAAVDIRVFIRERYTNLVHDSSKFWNASGFDVKVGLFKGAEINIESLRSLVAGGISFATPDDPKGGVSQDGTVFVLHEEPKKEWLEWNPSISVPAEK